MLHVLESSPTASPRRKAPPDSSKISVPFTYKSSQDGTDENLLILLHGLGDTHVSFAKLGRALNLPQTATLALRAPEKIPFLDEEAYQWYPSFDPLCNLIEHPNPSPALDLLSTVHTHLISDCGWSPRQIHLFGFAQGGSVVAEAVFHWWKRELSRANESQRKKSESFVQAGEESKSAVEPVRPLGSAVTVGGPLLSYPTFKDPCPTPLLVFHRGSFTKSTFASFRKAFGRVEEIRKNADDRGDIMPHSREEWEPIMRFWSGILGYRNAEGVYEVMTNPDK